MVGLDGAPERLYGINNPLFFGWLGPCASMQVEPGVGVSSAQTSQELAVSPRVLLFLDALWGENIRLFFPARTGLKVTSSVSPIRVPVVGCGHFSQKAQSEV